MRGLLPLREASSGFMSKISMPCIFPSISNRSRPVAWSRSVGTVPGAAPGGRRSASVWISGIAGPLSAIASSSHIPQLTGPVLACGGLPSKGFTRASGSPGLGAVLWGVALGAWGSVDEPGDGLRRRNEDVKVRAAMGLTTACLDRPTAERRRNIVGWSFGAVVGAFGGKLQGCGCNG